jgi:hypothetical protein
MIGISRRFGRAAMWARVARYLRLAAIWMEYWNVGRTGGDFQYSVHAINGLLRIGLRSILEVESLRKSLARRQFK